MTKFSFSWAVNGGNGGVKNKMFNNSSILTGKKHVVQIYKIKLQKITYQNEVPRSERFKVCCTTWYQDPGDRYTWFCGHFWNFVKLFKKCLNKILVIKKEKNIFHFINIFLSVNSSEAIYIFWPFFARALWSQKLPFWQKNNFTKFVFILF